MRSNAPGMSPAKIAIAVAVTIEAIAGTGSMKKVTGTRSAVAIVAVSPGTAPTKSPNAAEPRITQSTYGSKTSRSASKSILLEQSPGKRNAQDLVEGKVDGYGRDDCNHDRHAPRSSQNSRPEREERDAGEVETDRIHDQDVEHEAAKHARNSRERPTAEHPVGQREPRAALAYAGNEEEKTADAKPGRDEPGKPRRAELLARHGREPLDVPEDRRGERDQRRARQRIVDLDASILIWRALRL